MATIIGRNAKLATSTDGVTYYDIGKATSIGQSWATDMADETNNDSAGYKEEQYADSQLTFDVSGKYDSSDTGQSALMDCAFNKTKVYFRFRPTTGVGEQEWLFQGHCADFSLDSETGSVEDFSATVNSSGTVTKQAQT